MTPPIELAVPLPDILHVQDGEIRVKGFRITLYHVVTAHNEQGIEPQAMASYFPTLSQDEVRQVLEFYRANRAAVDEYAAIYRAELDRQRAVGKTLNLDELRQRLEEKQRATAGGPANNGHTAQSSDAKSLTD